MRTNNLIILILAAVILVALLAFGVSMFTQSDNTTNNTTNNTTENITLNDTNDTNNTTQQTTQKKTTQKKSQSSDDDIPTEGSYKGIDYTLHKGGYPYYSPQNEKTYHNKREEYNDMKAAIDSGIAD
ncbi:MAG: hypothetical protein BZ138_00330 [Methanosphaera sp. rholeuAM270]|nr:MAG: hypothetical protein BZ138_00330 [Methanosphaera sp. rholeuAM270]